MTVYKWSQTAATNATADGTVNWAEGQAPSTVNDSARAMMAAIAKLRDDMAATLTTAGSSTAYTLASNQVFDTLANMNGKAITFVAHATNGAAATLNVDGLGAKALQSASGVAVPAGTLIAGQAYSAAYKNSIPAWIVFNGGPGTGLNAPAGTAMMFQQTAAPTGWTKQVTHNDKSLRLVSGTPSSGGSVPFSTFTARTTTDAFLITTPNLPAHAHTGTTGANTLGNHTHTGTTVNANATHTHTFPNASNNNNITVPVGVGQSANSGVFTGTTGADGNLHTHDFTSNQESPFHQHNFTTDNAGGGAAMNANIDCRLQFVDVIIATKDA